MQSAIKSRMPTGVVLRGGKFVAPGTERIIIRKNDEKTVSLQKSHDGEFSEPAQPLAYCPASAQRAYADSKKTK